MLEFPRFHRNDKLRLDGRFVWHELPTQFRSLLRNIDGALRITFGLYATFLQPDTIFRQSYHNFTKINKQYSNNIGCKNVPQGQAPKGRSAYNLVI